MRKPTSTLQVAVAAAMVLAGAAHGATHAVPAAHSTIAAGLNAAADGDTVLVAAGTYREHDLILPSGVTLLGATGNPADVVIDGERAGRCIYGSGLSAATRLQAVTLFNGLPAWGTTPHNAWGGGLMVDGGSLSVLNCIFRQNETAIGGGAFVQGQGSPRFEDCLFDRNSATEDSGMMIAVTGNPVIRRCTFTGGDRCLYGGGLGLAIAGEGLIEECVIENNTVWETGGGLEILGLAGRVTVRNCLIRGNAAQLGGGGLVVGNRGRAILENCTITENSAGQHSGGVYAGTGAVIEGYQSRIQDNTAPVGPDGSTGSTAIVTLTCCEVDLAQWEAAGPLILVDEGCGVGTETATWGKVKALFR